MKQINKNTRSTRGFTLIETLIAVSLIAIAFSSFVDLLVKSIQATRITHESYLASSLASDAMEIVKNKKDNHVGCVKNNPPCATLSGTLQNKWQDKLVGGPYEVDVTQPNRQLATGNLENVSGSLDRMCVVETPAQHRGKFAHCDFGTGTPLPGNFTRTVTVTAVGDHSVEVTVEVNWDHGSLQTQKLLFNVL